MNTKYDEKEVFVDEFNKTLEAFIDKYPDREEEARQIVGHMINHSIRNIRKDITELPTFLELYKTRLKGTLYLCCDDFTNTEKLNIIKESYLNERDKKLALMYFVEYKTEQEIADTLGYDIRTIRNNIPKISLMLKKTSAKLYSK